MSDNKSLVVEILSNVFDIVKEVQENNGYKTYKITGIKTQFKSNNDKVTAIGNIAVINIDNFIYEYVNRNEDTQFITADEIEYNPDDFDLPVKYTITKISDVFIITGLDTRMYSVDNKCVVDCPPEAYYPNTLRHHGIYSHNSNHRFLVQLPRGDIYTPNDFYPVFTDLGVAVEFRNVLYKYNKHKYKNILQNEIPIYYFDAMNDKLDNKDLLEYSDRVSFIKGKAIGRVCDAPLDIGNHEFYDNGIWLHPEGKNTGIIDSPDKYYHKDVYKIGDKIYQADFLAIDRKEDFIPRGLLAEFLSKNQHVTKVREGKCLFIDNLFNDFIKFIRDYSGCRILAEKAYKIQDMLRDGALSNKMITYQLNLGISNIVNDNTSFMLLENDNRDNNDGFYLAPNRMSSYLKPVFPTKGSKNKSIGNVFEVSESINLSKGEYVLFNGIYFRSTLVKIEDSYTYRYFPLQLVVKYSEIDKYLIAKENNKDKFFNDNNLIYCNETCGVERIMFNHYTVDDILTFDKVKIVTESDLNKHKIFKIAEGIYGRTDEFYSFTDCSYSSNELTPFYEYLPK